MKYQEPIGAAENAPYVNADPGSGVDGSIVPASAIEHPQRELVAAILGMGGTPNDASLDQLWQGLQATFLKLSGGMLIGDFWSSQNKPGIALLGAFNSHANGTAEVKALADADGNDPSGNAVARHSWAVNGVANAYVLSDLLNAAGVPYFNLAAGSGVNWGYFGFPGLSLRSAAGAARWHFALNSNQGMHAEGLAAPGAGMINCAGIYKNGVEVVTGTPLSSFTGANQSLAPNGYQKLPGGLILQWGQFVEASRSTQHDFGAITLPIAFPTAPIFAAGQTYSTGAAVGAHDSFASLKALSASQVHFYADSGVGSTYTYGLYWFAIGH